MVQGDDGPGSQMKPLLRRAYLVRSRVGVLFVNVSRQAEVRYFQIFPGGYEDVSRRQITMDNLNRFLPITCV